MSGVGCTLWYSQHNFTVIYKFFKFQEKKNLDTTEEKIDKLSIRIYHKDNKPRVQDP